MERRGSAPSATRTARRCSSSLPTGSSQIRQLWASDRRRAVPRRDSQSHQPADSVCHLQPPPFRSHRRRPDLQGGRCSVRGARDGKNTPDCLERSAHRSARRGSGGVVDEAKWHRSRVDARPFKSFGQHPRDATAEGTHRIRGRPLAGRPGSWPQHDRLSTHSRPNSIKQIIAMDWERLIPGHPGPNGRLGTKQDAQDQLTFLQDASSAVKAEAQLGRCWEPVESQLKLPNTPCGRGTKRICRSSSDATAASGVAEPSSSGEPSGLTRAIAQLDRHVMRLEATR